MAFFIFHGDSNFVYLEMKKLILLFSIICISNKLLAQHQTENSLQLSQQELFHKVAHLDSVLFAAYNSENLELMKTYFTQDLEWYQDNGGLILYDQVFANFQSIFNREYTLKRTLIKESLEVHPIQGNSCCSVLHWLRDQQDDQADRCQDHRTGYCHETWPGELSL